MGSVCQTESAFNLRAPLAPRLLPEDSESLGGRLAIWVTDLKGCSWVAVAMVVDFAMLFFQCICCQFAQAYYQTVENHSQNLRILKNFEGDKSNCFYYQKLIVSTLEEHYEHFNMIPEYDCGTAETPIAIELERMTAPVMKGVDLSNRPFIALDVVARATDERKLILLFQDAPVSSQWVCRGNFVEGEVQSIFTEGAVTNQYNLHKLADVVNGSHPNFSLYNRAADGMRV